ncbi:MAG: hypothetical protein B7733_15605 [Myxococcales bacterium FL481]|nr:MAG: hypothetical protein B7733_15605 [Myxococcales bacterium FL481]
MSSSQLSRLLGLCALVAAGLVPGLAQAGDGPSGSAHRQTGPSRITERNSEFTFAMGYGGGLLSHPNYLNDTAHGIFFDIGFGFILNRRWTVGGFFNHIEQPINLVADDEYTSGRSGEAPQTLRHRAPCGSCLPPLRGGNTIARQLYTAVVGPRVEFAPFGKTGPYAAASIGVGTIAVKTHNIGSALGLKTGYRFFPAEMVAVGIGLNVQHIAAPESDAWLAMGSIDLRGVFLDDNR